MMCPLLSLVLSYQSTTDYTFLAHQDLQDCELVIGIAPEDQAHFATTYPSLQHQTVVLAKDDGWETTALNQLSGKYFLIVTAKEVWEPQFIAQVKNLLQTHPDSSVSKVLFLMGFIKTPSKTYFAPQAVPRLARPNSLATNFWNPTFFGTYCKYIYVTSLVKDFRLKFDPDIKNGQLRQSLFLLDYLASCFQQHAYVEPEFVPSVGSFMVGPDLDKNPQDLDIYHQHVLDKHEIWEHNPWQRVFWLSKLYRFLEKQKEAKRVKN